MIEILTTIGLIIGLFLSSMGVIKAREIIIDIIHAKRGEFKIYKIKPNLRVVNEWRKLKEGFLVKGSKEDDKIPYNEEDGTKLFGGFLGNTPIMYIDHEGNIINFKFEQIYVDVPLFDENGEQIYINEIAQTEKKMMYQRKDGVSLSSDKIDSLCMVAEAHGRLAAIRDDNDNKLMLLIILALAGIVVLVLGVPMLQGV